MKNNKTKAFQELQHSIYAALETYSNVHRGSGHKSKVSTHLYEQAREIVLEYLGLKKHGYTVVFCSPRRAAMLEAKLHPGSFHSVSSQEFGLSLGIIALAVKKGALPKGPPAESGGGTTKLISEEWIIWADGPDKFEAGTPPIINVITLAKALQLIGRYGDDIFKNQPLENLNTESIFNNDKLSGFSGAELLNELRKTQIGRQIMIATTQGEKRFINFDSSASTPTFEPIWDVFRHTMALSGPVQEEIISRVEAICCLFLNADPERNEIIFTSNTTEGINIVAESLSRKSIQGFEPVVLNTFLEHSSNDLPWRSIPHSELLRFPVDDEGFINLKDLDILLEAYNHKNLHGKKRINLVAVSAASNVMGSCNNIEEISRIVHKYGALLLVDGAQVIAHKKADMAKWGADFLVLSAHKVYAPFGCGVLLAKKGMLHFTENEKDLILASGRQNTAGIAALGKALQLMERIGMENIESEEQELTRVLLQRFSESPDYQVYGINDPDSQRLPQKLGVIIFNHNKSVSYKIASELALRGGIGVRKGCHCSHIMIKRVLGVGPGLERFQRVIQTLISKMSFPGVLRVSLGLENTKEDIDVLMQTLSLIAGKESFEGKTEESMTVKEAGQQMKVFIKTRAQMVYGS